jgi:hypothetical protein
MWTQGCSHNRPLRAYISGLVSETTPDPPNRSIYREVCSNLVCPLEIAQLVPTHLKLTWYFTTTGSIAVTYRIIEVGDNDSMLGPLC